MAAPEAQQERFAERAEGPERRAYPRHAVDCAAMVFPVSGSVQIQGRLSDLSLGGCRVAADHRYTAGILVRVEVQFQLRGIAFRIVGVTVGSRETKSFAIRFLEMPARRRQELAEVLDEVASTNAAKEAAGAVSEAQSIAALPAVSVPVSRPIFEAFAKAPERPVETQHSAELAVASRTENATATNAAITAVSAKAPEKPKAVSAASKPPAERRAQSRHPVDTSAKLLLVKSAISMPGRILNLSLGGCRIRTEERFNVGIYVRIEAEFYLHGLPFRVGGVSQAILDKNTIGVRFLDMSERRRDQLNELMAEIAEAATSPSSTEFAGIVEQPDQSNMT